jgi:hypothetical protein
MDLPDGDVFEFKADGGALTVAIVANFTYQAVVDGESAGWLQVHKAEDGRSIFLSVEPYFDLTPREGKIILQPEDNPEFTCAVLTVRQTSTL